jgi:hypothetical protein
MPRRRYRFREFPDAQPSVPRPLRFNWSMSNEAGVAHADANGDSLYAHRTGPWVRTYAGRINGLLVTADQPSLRLAELEVERIYLERLRSWAAAQLTAQAQPADPACAEPGPAPSRSEPLDAAWPDDRPEGPSDYSGPWY